MKMQLKKDEINNIFNIFLIIHLIVWVMIPTLTNNNLPLDTIEALAWGSDMDWGFNKHPPVSAFLTELFYQIFGNQDWAYYFLSQICVVISFFIVWKFSNEFFHNKVYGLLSVLILEGIYFYNYTTPEFNVYICELPFWALTVFYCWKSLEENNIKNWILFGFFAGLGFLSHYLFIYLILAIKIFFYYLIIKEKKFNLKYLIPSIVFILVIFPHLFWLKENNYITINYALHRTGTESSNFLDHLVLPSLFFIKQIGILIPFWVMLFLIVSKKKIKINLKDKKTLFLFFITIVPIILMFITSLIMGIKIKTMWMTPFYLFMGIFFIHIFKKQINLDSINKFVFAFVIFFILSPLTYAVVSITQDNKRTDYNGKFIAAKVQKLWNEDHNEKINVVFGNEWEAGNLSYHLKSRPAWKGIVTKDKLKDLLIFQCIDSICVGNKKSLN